MGWEEGVLKSDPSFSTSLFPDHWAWSSKTPHLCPCPAWVKAVEGWSHHDQGEGAALLLLPPSYKVGFKLGRMGPHNGFPQEQGFWARVCKAIFLCGGKGRRGMNTGWGERVRNGGEGRRKGPPCWSTVTGVIQTKKHACAQDPQCACSQPLQPGPTPPLRAPSKTPEKVLGVQL